MSLRPNDIPKGNIGVESVDSSSAALKWLDPNKSTFRAKLRDSSGVTHGEAEMPETAPLVYPDTGYAELSKTAKVPGEQKSGEFSSYQKVVGKYFDKRAQAKYVRFVICVFFFTLLTTLVGDRHTSIPNLVLPRKRNLSSLPNTATRLIRPLL